MPGMKFVQFVAKVTFVFAAILGAAFVLSAMSLFDLMERGPQPD